MFDAEDLKELIEEIAYWFTNNVWTPAILHQSVIIGGSFIIGGIIYHFSRQPITDTVENSNLPVAVKKALRNIRRIVMPVATLGIMFLASLIAASDLIGVNVSLVHGVLKVLLAWIVIRIALQFIENSLIRNFFALSIWLIAALSIFGVLDETSAALDAIGFSIGKFRLSALAVAKSLFSIFILLYLAGLISTFAERRILRSKSLRRSSQVLVAKIVRGTLIVCALLIAVTSAGIDLSIFTIFSGALGLGLGFGLQRIASNLVSGLLLLLDRSIEPGDVIEIESSGTFGWVHHMGARCTEIITRDNKSYLIPNEDFVTQKVVNWSHGKNLIRLECPFFVDYQSDPQLVMDIAAVAAATPERVVDSPKPVCWLTAFGENGLHFSLRFWIKDAEAGVTNVKGEVLLALWDAFKQNGIKIPYPRREIVNYTP
jgi:small-conductance mechanosensitive channel